MIFLCFHLVLFKRLQCITQNVYKMIAQHWALQTGPMVIWIWTFWEIAPNSSLLLAYKIKTSIHLPVSFTLPLYLLHLLTDILSSCPGRLTGPLSLVGPQTTDVVLNLETLISVSSSLSVSSLSIVAVLNSNFVAFLYLLLRSNLKWPKNIHDFYICCCAYYNLMSRKLRNFSV